KWIADDKTNIASLSAADQEISRIQGEIAKRQNEMKEVDTQRVAALEDAEKAMKTSESTKGRESVDSYKQYSDSKKKASDLQATILAQTVKDADDARQKAIESITSAIEEFGKASDSANTGGREMSELADKQPGVASVVKIAKEVLAPQVYKMRQATAERVLGEM